jgi:hypothetical protein
MSLLVTKTRRSLARSPLTRCNGRHPGLALAHAQQKPDCEGRGAWGAHKVIKGSGLGVEIVGAVVVALAHELFDAPVSQVILGLL